MHSKLVLGTAQLGMDYGAANKTGQPPLEKSCAIVKAAWDNGVRYFDTARSYGSAESVLGKVFDNLGIRNKVFIISKIPGEISRTTEARVLNGIEESLRELKVNRLYGLFLHDPKNLLSWNSQAEKIIKKIKKTGMAERIGVSVYTYNDALKVLRSDAFDMVQMPFNIFDQSFSREGVSALARKKRKLVFVRSIFLQGLLLMDASQLKGRFRRFAEYLAKRDNLCREFGLNRKELAIGYVKKRAGGAHIIFGAETSRQVIDTVDIFSRITLEDAAVKSIEEELSVEDERLINPSKWN